LQLDFHRYYLKQCRFHQIDYHRETKEEMLPVVVLTFNSSTVGRMSVADMSGRLAPDNAASFVEDAAAAVVGDVAAVAAADCRSIASMDAHCKVVVLSYRAAFDCIRLTAALKQRFEWENDYRQQDLRTAPSRP